MEPVAREFAPPPIAGLPRAGHHLGYREKGRDDGGVAPLLLVGGHRVVECGADVSSAHPAGLVVLWIEMPLHGLVEVLHPLFREAEEQSVATAEMVQQSAFRHSGLECDGIETHGRAVSAQGRRGGLEECPSCALRIPLKYSSHVIPPHRQPLGCEGQPTDQPVACQPSRRYVSSGLKGDTMNETARVAGRREWVALSVLSLAVFLLSVDGTVLSLAVPALSAALEPTATQLLWIGDIYSFALAGLLVTMGNLGDRIGRKRLLMIGAVGFGLASALAAFSPTAEVLIASRALLGLAGATLMPSTLSIIRAMFADARQRTTAIAVWGAMATAGAAAGPLIGGVLLEHFWWGSVFLINVPVMVVLVALGIRLIPESRNPSPGPFDLLSAALSMAGIVPVVYAIKQLASGDADVPAAVSAIVGVIALIAFGRRQRRLDHPLIDLSLFRRPAFAGAVASNFLAIFSLSGLLFFLSQYLQLVRGYGPLDAGLRQLPITLASVASAVLVGVLVARVGRGHLIGASMLVSALGLGLLVLAEGTTQYLWLALAMTVIGAGIGLALTLTTDSVVSAVPTERAGAASAVSETAYELGVALGIALLGSLHTVLYRAALAPLDLGEAGEAIRSSLASATAAVGDLPVARAADVLHAARDAFTQAMQTTTVAMACVLAVAAVIAWRIIPSTTPRRAKENDATGDTPGRQRLSSGGHGH